MEQSPIGKELNAGVKLGREKLGSANDELQIKKLKEIELKYYSEKEPFTTDDIEFLLFVASTKTQAVFDLERKVDHLQFLHIKASLRINDMNCYYEHPNFRAWYDTPNLATYHPNPNPISTPDLVAPLGLI